MIPTSEQVEEFCLGLGLVPVCGGFGEVAHYNPEEDKPIELDLNNLFEYGVLSLLAKEDKGDYYKVINNWHRILLLHYEPFDPALALFWAMYPVITGKEVENG